MQPTLKDWLDRKPKGKAPRKRIPAMSAKRKKEAALYSKKRKAFLEAHPHCEATWIIWPNRPTRPAATEVHHRCKRGVNYLNEKTWMAVSREAHLWIHGNPAQARYHNLLA